MKEQRALRAINIHSEIKQYRMNQSSPIGVSNLLQQIISPGDVILDLGAFASGTTRAFLKKRCRCYVEDLPEFIDRLEVHDEEKIIAELEKHLMILKDDVKVDVILTWDLFHYLDLNIISSLFELLDKKIKTSTIVHSTRHTSTLIPKKPQRFKLLDDFSFEIVSKQFENEVDNEIPNESYATIDLLKKLRHFNLCDTLIHKHKAKKGLVEYALCYGNQRATKKQPNLKIISPHNSGVSLLSGAEFSDLSLPNLHKLLTSYKLSKASYVIDCSGSLVSNQAVVSQLSSYFFEENIYSFMAWQQQISIGRDFVISDQMLRYHQSVKFDLVMLWDLINFWQPHETKSLIERIVQHMEPKGLLHMVIPHARGAAEKPANYRITKDLKVELNGELCGNNQSKLLTTGELVRLLPNFKVLSYYFGTRNNGENYQEYVFEYQGCR